MFVCLFVFLRLPRCCFFPLFPLTLSNSSFVSLVSLFLASLFKFVPLRSSFFLSLITFWLISSFSVSRFIYLIIHCSFHLSFFCLLFLSSFLYFLPSSSLRLSLLSYFLSPCFLLIISYSIHNLHFAHFSSFLTPFPACFNLPFRFFYLSFFNFFLLLFT